MHNVILKCHFYISYVITIHEVQLNEYALITWQGEMHQWMNEVGQITNLEKGN